MHTHTHTQVNLRECGKVTIIDHLDTKMAALIAMQHNSIWNIFYWAISDSETVKRPELQYVKIDHCFHIKLYEDTSNQTIFNF